MIYLIRVFLFKKHGITHYTALTRTLGLIPGRQRVSAFSALPLSHGQCEDWRPYFCCADNQRRTVNEYSQLPCCPEHSQLPRGPSVWRTGAKGDSEILHVSSSQPPLDLKNMFQSFANIIWKLLTWSPPRGKDGNYGRVSSSTPAKD